MSNENVFAYEEAVSASLSYFGGDELAAKVFVDKYALRNSNQELLEKTPDDMHHRIARELARIEKKKFKNPLSHDEIFSYLKGFKRIIPQGSPMTGIGNTEQYVTLSNCYVVDPPEDSYGGIHHTDQQITQISKRRGGTGLDISKLRPAGSLTANSSRTSTGIVPFMERFSNSIREVGQGGRRGALMMTIDVHHPQVLDFATVKNDLTKVTGANISIRLSDEFLNAVSNNEDYEQRWPVEKEHAKIRNSVNAKKVWEEIIKNAHAMAEPGLLFWDNILRNSPADCYAKFGFKTVGTNPCSELPLSVLDSCRLLLLRLLTYVNDPYTEDAHFDFDYFYKDVKVAQRLMDDIVDLELEHINRIINKILLDPEPDHLKAAELAIWQRIRYNCETGRRTGTGITALGDTLAALGLKYDSDEGIEIAETIFKTLKFAAYESSMDMAEELGPFTVWDHELEKDCEFFKRFATETLPINCKVIKGKDLMARMKKVGRRNIAMLTSAPAGSVSILTQTSSGIEPVYKLSFFRKKKGNHNDAGFRIDFTDKNGDTWMEFEVYHPPVNKWMEVTGKTDLKESPWHGSCADDLNWRKRVELQARANRHVDHAISSTLNLPNNTTVEQVAEIYETAWRAECKGITVYRDGCRDGVLTTESVKDKKELAERPKNLPCDIHHISVNGQKYFTLVGLNDDIPYEVFAGRNGFLDRRYSKGIIKRKKKGFYELYGIEEDGEKTLLLAPVTAVANEHEETITRLASLALRSGGDVHLIVQQLEKVNGEMNSFAKSVARALKRYIKDGTPDKGESCPQCHQENIVRQEGCKTCKDCGWSACN